MRGAQGEVGGRFEVKLPFINDGPEVIPYTLYPIPNACPMQHHVVHAQCVPRVSLCTYSPF